MHWQQSGIKNNLSELCKQAQRAQRPPARATVTFMEKLIKSTLSLRNASSSLTRASRPSHRRVVTVRPTHHREALLLHLWPPCLWWYTWSSSLLTSTPSGTERDFRERRVDKVETHEIWYIQTDQCETVCSTLPGSYLKHHDCECPEDRLREKQRLFLLSYIRVCGVHRAAGFPCSTLLFRHFLTVSLINTFSCRDVVIRHKLEMLDYSERLFGSEQKQLIYVSPFGGFVSWKKVLKAWKWDWLFFYRRPIKCL